MPCTTPITEHLCAHSPKPDPTRPPDTTDPADWINAATEVLVNQSIDAVRVDVLAKGLGVTRGSFYWHFQDRDDLLRKMLTSWRDGATEQLIQRFESSNAAPESLIHELAALPFRGKSAIRSASIELAIRAWARRDDMARHYVDEVDTKRLAYITHCFIALGKSIPEGKRYAFLLYSYMIGESLLANQGSEDESEQRRQFVEKLLTGA